MQDGHALPGEARANASLGINGTVLTNVNANATALSPEYLGKVADILLSERDGMVEEMNQLANNIEHIKVIVAMQQDYAKGRGIVEKVKVSELVEDALGVHQEDGDLSTAALSEDERLRPHPAPERVSDIPVLDVKSV